MFNAHTGCQQPPEIDVLEITRPLTVKGNPVRFDNSGTTIALANKKDGGQPPKKPISVWKKLSLILVAIATLLVVVAKEPRAPDPERINRMKDKFLQACKDNDVDPQIGQQILAACLRTPKPYTVNPCEKWAELVDAKLPPRMGTGLICSTAHLNAQQKTTTGVFADQVAWGFHPCSTNLWCVFASGHFAIRVHFPDGQQFLFDDGNWGSIFQPGDVPEYAR